MSQVEVFNFSSYTPSITQPNYGQKWTLNGDHNLNYKIYQDAFDDSPTNSFIINRITNYIIGSGLVDKSGAYTPSINLSNKDLRLLCLDYKTHGAYSVQIIWDSNEADRKPLKIYHLPIKTIGLAIDLEPESLTYLQTTGYWYCFDWTNQGKFKPVHYPKFDGTYKDAHIEILVVQRPSSEPFFPFPDYFSGLKSAQIEAALLVDALNHVQSGFAGKTVINMNVGSLIDEDVKEASRLQVKKSFTGVDNAGGVIVSINESPEQALIVDTIEPRGRNEQFVSYDETAEIKLMASHQALSILFARPGTSGFSSNADEIAVATKSLYSGVINPMREVILDGLAEIFSVINPSIILDFDDFKEDNTLINNTTATTPVKMDDEKEESKRLDKFKTFLNSIKW